jgi:methyl-accepting chemotaxis protein
MKQRGSFWRNRKKIILVNRDFQLRYTRAAVFVGVISTIFTAAVILLPLYKFKILRIPVFLPWPFLLSMSIAAVVNILLIAMLGLYLTHKIAGPMYSIVKAFRRVEQGGNLALIHTRKGDDLTYITRNFNYMLTSLRDRFSDDTEKIGEVLRVIEKTLAERSDDNLLEAKRALEKLQQRNLVLLEQEHVQEEKRGT